MSSRGASRRCDRRWTAGGTPRRDRAGGAAPGPVPSAVRLLPRLTHLHGHDEVLYFSLTLVARGRMIAVPARRRREPAALIDDEDRGLSASTLGAERRGRDER